MRNLINEIGRCRRMTRYATNDDIELLRGRIDELEYA